jgi:hypothetical protein
MVARRVACTVLVLTCAGGAFGAVSALATGRSGRIVPTTASNKRAAIRDANSLLAGVVPPAGAVLQSSGTRVGPRAPLLTTAFASAVAYSTWNVPQDPASVLPFVETHLPPGSQVVSTGSEGPNPSSQSVIRSWPPVSGVLYVRWLEITVTSLASGGTKLYAKSQSQWVVTRPPHEHIPPGVRAVEVTSGSTGMPPFVWRQVTNRAKIRTLVKLFDTLEIVQPGAINCPGFSSNPPTVTVDFRGGPTDRLLADANVDAVASFSWPADTPGWECFPVAFTVLGRHWPALSGNVITPIERLLGVRLAPRK